MKPALSHLKVGDTVPFHDIDREAVLIAKKRLGSIRAAAKSKKNLLLVNKAKKIMREHDERDQRLSDPFEQARGFLIRRGHRVNCMSVFGGPKGFYRIGSRHLSKREVMTFAKERGWAA